MSATPATTTATASSSQESKNQPTTNSITTSSSSSSSSTSSFHLDNLAVLGCGVMGKAITQGLIDNNVIDASNITVSVLSETSASSLLTFGGAVKKVKVVRSNVDAIKASNIVLLCIKPFYVHAALSVPEVVAALKGKLLISICAGVTLNQLAALLPETRIVRAMTNTPAKIRQGMTAVCGGPLSTKDDAVLTTNIFKNVGRCVELPESQFDTVTALAGSGPAFAFMFIEALADGAVMMGMPRKIALEMAAQMVYGSSKLALDSGEHPAVLKDNVTTPGGCTIAGLLTLEDGKFRGTVSRTIEAATKRASELGQVKK